MSLPDLYRQRVLEHNRAPQHCHAMDDADCVADGVNALCGDELRFYAKLDGDTVSAASFTGEACAIVTACASMLTEYASGRSRHELSEAYRQFRSLLADAERDADSRLGDFNALLEVRRYPGRSRCATLPWETLQAALNGQSLASTERTVEKSHE